MTLLDGPLGFVVVLLVFFGLAASGLPSRRRHQLQVEEIRSRSGEQFKELNTEYIKLAHETRETTAGMQADIAAIRASVESIEQMMRDVG